MKADVVKVRRADVVIPIYADVEVTRACIDSVLRHSGESLRSLILVNDCSPDPDMYPMLRTLRATDPRVVLLENDVNLGFVGTCNRGLAIRGGDVVLLNSDTRVTEGWLEELLGVAYLNDRICAVVPLSNNATICSVPAFCKETKAQELEGRPLELETFSPRYTEVPTGVGFCLLLRHVALNMLGGLDPAYGRGYNEENDWCLRAQRLGLQIVRANRALVYHLGSISFGEERNELERLNARRLHARYPHYPEHVGSFVRTTDAHVAAHYVRRRLGEVAACLDGRHIVGLKENGTGVHAAELAKALVKHTDVKLSVWVSSPEQRKFFERQGVRTVEALDTPPPQVLHRSAQVLRPEELRSLLDAPSHAVISYQDLIAYRAPTTHPNYGLFRRYRALSFASLHAAQAVIAISEHNRQEIISEFQVPPERVHTVHLGVDVDSFADRDETANQKVLEKHSLVGPFLLSAGSDFAHKNLRLLVEGYQLFRAGWKHRSPVPKLIFIGPRTKGRGALYDDGQWPEGVRYLGTVAPDEVRALFQESSAYFFPTAYEGFGLPVLEAMAAGTPVVCSSLTSVPEVAGDAALYLESFSPEEIAARMLSVTTDAGLRKHLVAAGHEQVKRFTWKETARRTEAVYQSVIDSPAQVTLHQKRALALIFEQWASAEERAHIAEHHLHHASQPVASGPGILRTLRGRFSRR
ncbi:glycosyltransferase [Pyxidicoccus sp. MSG2]|uniref:glycosyltransferase n=1 Tax=Pyxidicoccus sp. MSG2 TaxID=2996790 RepID=UPI00226EEAF7|nr:glycosyltransferase [Pyxidicoccus sp. MSG2]MCY1022013.1 glycosyltransferase [Pyxidicoccus sp. MSG2]